MFMLCLGNPVGHLLRITKTTATAATTIIVDGIRTSINESKPEPFGIVGEGVVVEVSIELFMLVQTLSS